MNDLNWRSLNAQMDTFSEQTVLDLLNAERAGKRRVSIMVRLHQKYSRLRADRERLEILGEGQQP